MLTQENIKQILLKFPRLRGVSIGRGLLSSPLMAKELKNNETFSEKERMSLYFSFHEALFKGWSEQLQGENQLLMRLKTLWEYFLPVTDRKVLKRIKKSNHLKAYQEAVAQVWKGDFEE